MHSIVAFIFAIALVAVVGVVFDPLDVTTEFDLPEVELEAFDDAYQLAYEEGKQRGIAEGRQRTLVALGLEYAEQDAPWIRGVREGWMAGWNDALDSLEQATRTDAPEDERKRELELLAEIERR